MLIIIFIWHSAFFWFLDVFTGQDEKMSNKNSQLTRVQRSPQNKEVDGNESETMINQSETNSLVR